MGYKSKQRVLNKKKSQIVERPLKNYSTSLAFREMQIKTTLRLCLTPIRMAKIKNTNGNVCWRGCETRTTLLYCCWELKFLPSLWKSIWHFLRKLEINLLQHPATPNLDINSKDTQSYHKDTCSTMFITALFAIARTRKQPRCTPTKECIQRMDKENVVHLHSGVLFNC